MSDLVPTTKYPADSAMAALPTEKMRSFVEAHFLPIVKQGHGQGAECVRLAGYNASTPQSLASMANNLYKDPRILAALEEMVRVNIRGLGTKAVAAISEIIDSPHHSHRLKAALAVIDRIDPTVQKIEVKNEVVDHTAESLKYLDHLLSIGTPREVLEREFGKFGLEYYSKLLADKKSTEPKIIDTEYTLVPSAQAADLQSVSVQEPDENLEDLL
jgi:hypothetical protein